MAAEMLEVSLMSEVEVTLMSEVEVTDYIMSIRLLPCTRIMLLMSFCFTGSRRKARRRNRRWGCLI